MSTKKTTTTKKPSDKNTGVESSDEVIEPKVQPKKTRNTGYQAFGGHYGDNHKAGKIGNSPRGTRRAMGSR